eukprot:Skav214894  [mRNA]  locus=scaffold1561:82019:83965:- [translate_table: standard]
MFAMRWWLWPLVASPVCTEHVQLLQQSLTLRKTSTSTSVSSLAFLQGCSGWDCLKEYVSADDGAFRWHATPHVIRGDGWTGTVLEMTSQRNHTLVVITPSNVTEDLCLIYIALGFYGSPQVPSSSVSNLDEDVLAAAEIAIAAGTHAAVLFNVRGIIPIARPLNLRSVLRLTQRELGGFPISTTLYAEKGLCGAKMC